MTIRIDVRRDDGEVTRLEGPAGIAIMMQASAPTVENVPDTAEGAREWAMSVDMPALSIRASQPEELVIMLACFIAFVKHQGDELLAAAMLLAPYVGVDRPDFRRVLPRV